MAREINLKRENKILWIVIASILLIVFSSSLVLFSVYYFDNYSKNPYVSSPAQNIILLIGDGMGEKHIEVAKLYEGKELTMTSKFGASGELITRSLTPGPTDSAASATAMATGKKVGNGRIGYYSGSNLKNFVEYSQELSKKTGVVTTKSVTDATPAAFSSHVKNRSQQEEIALQQIRNSNLDVLFGLGQAFFEQYEDEIDNETREYCVSFSELSQTQKEKVYCILPDDGISTIGNDRTLAVLTDKALDILSKDNNDGFFLMVEGAKIDTASHENNIQSMINELTAFDDAVAVALNFASANPNTTVLVVADHETGRIKIPADAEAQDISDDWYKTKNHTIRNVPYYIYGPGTGELPSILDNSDVFVVMCQLFEINSF
ncbi:MAG: alkaline phosphatase [Clostridia bacterium]